MTDEDGGYVPMSNAEYLAALQDIRTRRAETIRIIRNMMEGVWALRHYPVTADEMYYLGGIQIITDNLMTLPSVPDASISSSLPSPTHGGNGPVTQRPGPNLGIPSSENESQTPLTTTADTST